MKLFTLVASMALMTFFSTAAFSQDGQFRNGPQHNGVYTGNTNFDNVTLHWQFSTGGAIRSTPLVVNNKIYFGSADHYLYCLDTSGRQLWKFETEAGIHSSPAVADGIVFFNDRDNNLYALGATDGKQHWKKSLGKTPDYEWSFDYYLSSPLVDNSTVYSGSGDGNLYAIDIPTGNIKWKYNAKAIIRSTPALQNNKLTFGDCDGRLYNINATDGKLNWLLKLNGDTMQNENYGFDRKAVIAAPAIANNIVVVGDRAGYLYGINAASGEKIWQFDYHVSWILSSVAIKDSIVVTGTSDAAFINAINLYTGKEIWRFQTQAPVWASPIIAGNFAICPSNDGVLYGINLGSGKEVWRYSIGERFFSSPVIAGNKLYAANDDGDLYCFVPAAKNNNEVFKAVFWMKDPPFQYFQYGVDKYVRDYFRSWGYQVLDDKALATFMQERINDHKKSVIVFATNYFPGLISGDSAHPSLILDYLKAGGKTVICGMNPAVYQVDTATKQVTGLDFSLTEKVLGFKYNYNDTRAFNGFYPSSPTKEGRLWGLKTSYVSRLGQPDNVVDVVLMRDETGKATSWLKSYGGPAGMGFLQTWIYPSTLQHIDDLKSIAEYGL
ncbi:MAG TPA: PQQ-binding-like beta-propeller repeat protein [Chitinophagaceae bacterium]|nr:PQQ-binding-like beta-propeller repeat protein [Chitinophagaceae bacterium]